MKPVILSIDAGTGGCRVYAFSDEGHILCSAYKEWVYTSTKRDIHKAVEFDPAACWQTVCSLIKSTLTGLKSSSVKAVTVSSQRDGMVLLDSDGHELYCAPNMDLRGEAVVPLLEPYRDEIFKVTGLPLHGLFGLPRLLWHKVYALETYECIDCAFMVSDWLAWKLSGEKRSERAVASSSQMVSLQTGEYDAALMERLGLRGDIFPETCAAYEAIGSVPPTAANQIGLPAGIPVFIGGSDTHCGLAGMGLLEAEKTAVVAGTTTPVMTLCKAPLKARDDNMFSSCASVPNRWTLECNAGSTGFSYRWLRDLMLPGQPDAYAQMDAEAMKVPIGCDGLSATIGITLFGEGGGTHYGGFIFPVPWNIGDFTRGHFFRAALETNAYAVKANLTSLKKAGITPPDCLHMCGGQSANRVSPQMLSDVTGLPVQTYENPESTALGAALFAVTGAGLYASAQQAAQAFVRPGVLYEPDTKSTGQYQKAYCDWLDLRQYMIAYK